MRPILTLLLLALTLLPRGAAACGEDSDCRIGARSYRVHLPPGGGPGPIGALIFNHGYRGSAANEMKNMSLRRLADDLGVALIATKSAGPDWALPGAPSDPGRTGDSELAYFDAVLADITARFNVDPGRVTVSGFSAGAMMVWTLACHRGGSFAGFIALSGTFWAPVPETCDSAPASLVHIHGTADTTVPLGGRAIGSARQGGVGEALAMYARHGGFGAATESTIGRLACRLSRNAAGKMLGFCTFDGGHFFRSDDLRAAWDLLRTGR